MSICPYNHSCPTGVPWLSSELPLSLIILHCDKSRLVSEYIECEVMMATTYERYLKLNLDGSRVGLERHEMSRKHF
ncbi:hypothetical protein E4K67_24715 [Desulfosporosinus fructosivorans]|uniref:Uncharacterized protein n=1 Tax=Desulfosporosinus fructosivorans TaxID=2018669 RepID=A0A4Z0QXM4_9FIRM|nr:hypothetical protein E4K67_24715 [Desulfosporosinus fructosivorans]